jgi:hypothetical protein
MLILISPFSSIRSVITHHVGPLGYIASPLFEPFPNIDNVIDLIQTNDNIQIKIHHGELDTVVMLKLDLTLFKIPSRARVQKGQLAPLVSNVLLSSLFRIKTTTISCAVI